MADDVDRGQAQEEALRVRALRLWREQQGPALSPQESARWCEFCDDEIPEARRRAVPGCVRCVGCQTDLERGSQG